jgi:hypothetical protein
MHWIGAWVGSSIGLNVVNGQLPLSLLGIELQLYIITYIQSVHCAGLLDVQNILSADTVVCPGKLKVIHSVIT